MVVGSAFMPRVVKRLGKARSVSAGIIGLSLTSILLVVSQRLAREIDPQHWDNDWPFLALIIGLIFALGCELTLINIPALTLIQEHTPDTIKGRVLSLQSIMYNAASIPVILFIGGIADIYGIATVMWVLAGMVFDVSCVGVCFAMSIRRWPPSRCSMLPDASRMISTAPALSAPLPVAFTKPGSCFDGVIRIG